jgi:hypothetical protein
MKPKKKTCKAIGRAKGFQSCGQLKYIHRYGLCSSCFADWLYNTEPGKQILKQTMLRSKRTITKDLRIKCKNIPWYEKDLPEMKKYIQTNICNPYIRKRDFANFGKCISQSHLKIENAGHYFSCGSNESMRFCPQNIHGQSIYANYHLSGDEINFKKGLEQRFGRKYLQELARLKSEFKSQKKLTKDEVIKIGRTYKYLDSNNIWVFTQKEFDKYKDKLNFDN